MVQIIIYLVHVQLNMGRMTLNLVHGAMVHDYWWTGGGWCRELIELWMVLYNVQCTW